MKVIDLLIVYTIALMISIAADDYLGLDVMPVFGAVSLFFTALMLYEHMNK